MKRIRFKHTFILILIVIVIYCKIPFSISYPGDGDCKKYHGVSDISINYFENSEIKLDGVSNETFWNDIKNRNGFFTIPTANILGPPGSEITDVNLIFATNKQYLYIYCEWNDTSTKPSGINIFDGIFFCWNINTPNFTSYYPNDMNTEHMGGGLVDTWGFTSYYGDGNQNYSSFLGADGCIKESGWNSAESKDVEIGLSYIVDKSYSIEIKRKLITNDNYDIQFYEGKSYHFNIGLFNDGYDIDHTVSWTYKIFFLSEDDDKSSKNDDKTEIDIRYFIIIGSISIILIIAFIIYYKSKIAKNLTQIKNGN